MPMDRQRVSALQPGDVAIRSPDTAVREPWSRARATTEGKVAKVAPPLTSGGRGPTEPLRSCCVRRPSSVACRPVEVLFEGQWRPGDLEAYQQDAAGWSGFVRHSDGPGLNHLGWFSEKSLRRPKVGPRGVLALRGPPDR